MKNNTQEEFYWTSIQIKRNLNNFYEIKYFIDDFTITGSRLAYKMTKIIFIKHFAEFSTSENCPRMISW